MRIHKTIFSVFIIFSSTLVALSSVADSKTTKYAYDDLGRLKTVEIESTNLSKTIYSYDAADNRTAKSVDASLPLATISVATLTVSARGAGRTAEYRLKPDGYIQIRQSVPVNYGGATFYMDQTSTIGRWLAEGHSSGNFKVNTYLANGHGGGNCTSVVFTPNLIASYGQAWTMDSSGGQTKWCPIEGEI